MRFLERHFFWAPLVGPEPISGEPRSTRSGRVEITGRPEAGKALLLLRLSEGFFPFRLEKGGEITRRIAALSGKQPALASPRHHFRL